ncbi:KpsF/GutQ family sugar-phosphate isomerase [Candidatus Pelagibacter communis]|uniref:KpsF/GutQ family sugar-phosphate isomerase n=1 Tax=Pelagibacter ubique TaxID=198252 RepID=UPI00094CD594|nr:KpsF/GutQ family sugar-phosphate isomerase [Candidatus Pelagibacter ubique]
MKNQISKTGIEVIDLQIKALKKLKYSINDSFNEAVKAITKCKSKIIICGVGKSGKIASKISATLSSVGSPSFSISANDCSHGDLGRITNKDLLILVSYSGNTKELKDIIKYAKLNKITLIGIVSNKDSTLFKSANIKLFIPEVKESGLGIVPTSSTTAQLCLGDALAIASMREKKFSKLDFKKFHPAGNLGNKLKTAFDVMLIKNKIPFVNHNEIMKNALKILNSKKLGFLVVVNDQGLNTGVFTDGDLKRLVQKKKFIDNLKIKTFMTKKPIIVEKNTLATDILNQMNKKKITNVCVYSKENKKKTIGVIHIHNLINTLK